ncbi:MAG: DNA (cytosine-5-)-methyltransferase [Alphaproteobacteria bacterium]
MRYLSVCSGIEAASAAWHPLGWTPVAFSKVDKFPSAVLKHHYPHVSNWGDMTKFKEWPNAAIDVLVGGTPCQSFSVAGLRKGMDDPRGNLALTYLAIAARYRPQWLVWENVPGVLSSNKGRDFGSILGGMVELGYGIAYRVLDAQHFGVPQRRRRIFVVGYLGDWRRAAAVLFEQHSLQGHPPPRRETGQRVAPTISARTKGGGGLGTDFDCDGGLIPELCPTLVANGNKTGGIRPPGTDGDTVTSLIPVIMSNGQANAEILEDGGVPTLTCLHEAPIVAHALRAEGFDASEDGTGRGTPLIPVAFEWQRGATQNLEILKDQSPALIKSQTPAIAFSAKDHGADAGDISPTLRSMGHDASHANGGGQVAVAFESRIARNGRGAPSEIVPPLKAQSGQSGKGDAAPLVAFSIMPMNSGKDYKARETDVAQPIMAGGPVGGNQGGDFIKSAMQVRRLTPRECERLQGFPDDYTLIPWRGGMSPDGPRYKALGNSFAVPVVRWLGERIQLIENLKADK